MARFSFAKKNSSGIKRLWGSSRCPKLLVLGQSPPCSRRLCHHAARTHAHTHTVYNRLVALSVRPSVRLSVLLLLVALHGRLSIVSCTSIADIISIIRPHFPAAAAAAAAARCLPLSKVTPHHIVTLWVYILSLIFCRYLIVAPISLRSHRDDLVLPRQQILTEFLSG